MLKQRVLTGLVMAIGLIAAVGLLSLPFLALAFAVILGVAAWEWALLAGMQSMGQRLACVAVALLGAGFLYQYCKLGTTADLSRVQPLLGRQTLHPFRASSQAL